MTVCVLLWQQGKVLNAYNKVVDFPKFGHLCVMVIKKTSVQIIDVNCLC